MEARDLLPVVEKFLKFLDSKICKHYVAATILNFMETNGFQLSDELAAAVVKAEDETALQLIEEEMKKPKEYGCFIDLWDTPDHKPDKCVIDEGAPQDCLYAQQYGCKEKCPYWQPVTEENIRKALGDE